MAFLAAIPAALSAMGGAGAAGAAGAAAPLAEGAVAAAPAATAAAPSAAVMGGTSEAMAAAPEAGGLFGNIPSTVGANGVDMGGGGQFINFMNSLSPKGKSGGGPTPPTASPMAIPTPGKSSNPLQQVDLMQYLKSLGGGGQ